MKDNSIMSPSGKARFGFPDGDMDHSPTIGLMILRAVRFPDGSRAERTVRGPIKVWTPMSVLVSWLPIEGFWAIDCGPVLELF